MTAEMFAPDSIDRVTPTLRPADRTVMRQRWAHLLFLHWIVPPEQLLRLLPPGLELDTFEGNAYVGLVPFTMTGVRPVWAPALPPLSDFHETNVRTYVHRQGKNPGIWFLSLDDANAIAVRIARAAWKLPDHFARMSLDRREAEEGPTIAYETRRLWPGPTPATCTVRYTPHGLVVPAPVGTREHFLAERYILYAYRAGKLYSGQVNHVPYPLQQATVHELSENLIAAAGITRPDVAPIAHYAREVDVRIFPLKKQDF